MTGGRLRPSVQPTGDLPEYQRDVEHREDREKSNQSRTESGRAPHRCPWADCHIPWTVRPFPTRSTNPYCVLIIEMIAVVEPSHCRRPLTHRSCPPIAAAPTGTGSAAQQPCRPTHHPRRDDSGGGRGRLVRTRQRVSPDPVSVAVVAFVANAGRLRPTALPVLRSGPPAG